MGGDEVEIPYVDGPLDYDGNRELLAAWELEDEAPGAVDGSVFRWPEQWSPGWNSRTTTVHLYRLTRVDHGVGWEYRYVGIED